MPLSSRGRQKIPIGVQTFQKLIEEDYIYIDKTKVIYHLLNSGMVFFLSRPRRFGKSLLLSTIRTVFEGKKELFKGLWIETSDWDWTPHPVIHLDMSLTSHRSPEKLEQSLNQLLVLEGGQLVGFLHRADVIRYLQLSQELGMESK